VILDQISWFEKNSIQIHAQIVVCADINDGEESEYDFFSNFTCPKCNAYVEVYHHK